MDERIHQALDGELPRAALTPAELAELAAAEESLGRSLARVRAEAAPDLTAGVMARIAAPAAGEPVRQNAFRRLWDSVWRPRPVSFELRPAWALAAAALAGLLLWRPLAVVPADPGDSPRVVTQADAQPVLRAAQPGVVLVQFRLDAPGAEAVHLAGDFTDWQPAHALNPAVEGVWTITIEVPAGVHEYAFLVDGEEWVLDPLAPRVDDGFGGSNSRLDVVMTSPRGT